MTAPIRAGKNAMTIDLLLRYVRIALKRPRMLPSEKRLLLEEINHYLNTPRKYWDNQMWAAGEREDD